MKYDDRIKEYRKVKSSDLTGNPSNFRTHPKRQKEALQGSLRTVGQIAPLIAYEDPEKGLVLIDGHARVSEDEEWNVAVVDLSPEEARLAIALLDPIAAMAETDKDRLKELMDNVSSTDQSVIDHLARLARDNNLIPNLRDVDEIARDCLDKIDSLAEKWQVEEGDVYEIGVHTLACGDSTDEGTVAKAFRGRTPFMMVTDPPYGVNYNPEWRIAHNRGGGMYGKVVNDDTADWEKAYALSKADVVYIWHAATHADVVMRNIGNCNYVVRAVLVWRKNHFVMSQGHYHHQHEPCLYAVKKGATARWCGDRKQSTVWDIDAMLSNGHSKSEHDVPLGHSTQKPVECMARPIRNHGEKGDIIYDPFCGSGTTIAACEQEGRTGIGIELDPKYCAMILERMERIGLTPRKL
jgi:DNA modification methylase